MSDDWNSILNQRIQGFQLVREDLKWSQVLYAVQSITYRWNCATAKCLSESPRLLLCATPPLAVSTLLWRKDVTAFSVETSFPYDSIRLKAHVKMELRAYARGATISEHGLGERGISIRKVTMVFLKHACPGEYCTRRNHINPQFYYSQRCP